MILFVALYYRSGCMHRSISYMNKRNVVTCLTIRIRLNWMTFSKTYKYCLLCIFYELFRFFVCLWIPLEAHRMECELWVSEADPIIAWYFNNMSTYSSFLCRSLRVCNHVTCVRMTFTVNFQSFVSSTVSPCLVTVRSRDHRMVSLLWFNHISFHFNCDVFPKCQPNQQLWPRMRTS